MICNHNGHFIDPAEPVVTGRDGAWLYGDTLFETMRAESGRIRYRDRHLKRIEDSAALIGMPFDRPRVVAAVEATLDRAGAGPWRVRLTLSRGPFASLALPAADGGHFLVEAAPAGRPTEDERQNGVACVVAPNQRVNPLSHRPQMKRGNYADCLYAAHFARERGAREALFVTPEGLLLEGATSNLFLVRDGVLVTPPLGTLVLNGIVRGRVLELAAEGGMRTEVREASLDELFRADEAFLTNSLIDLLPIAEVDGRPVAKGPVAGRLLAALQDDGTST